MSESTDDQKQTEQTINGQLDDDFINKWHFDCQQLYKIALKFFKDNESKAFHPSYDKRNEFFALILQDKNGKFDSEKAKPLGALDIVGRDRRNSWISLGDMSKTDAQKGFIKLLDELCPLFEPYVKAIKCDFDEKERIKREAEELEKKRIAELEEKQRIEAEAKRKAEEELRQFDEQKRAIQEALNRQTLQQFKSYAEQQYPGNSEQQDILIKQLQEQHYQQYMQQMLEQQLRTQHQQNTNRYNRTQNNSQSSTTMNSINGTQQSNAFPVETLTLQHQFTEGDDQNHENNHLDSVQTGSESDSEEESIGPIAGASMWTRKDINMFKESIRSEGGDGIIKVGHGEIVTVRVPTHQDGTCIFWEFSTDSYDIGFGLLFEWTKNPGNQVSVHISESEDEEDDEEEGDIGNDVEKGNSIESEKETSIASSKRGPLEQSPISVIIPIYRRDSHEEVFAGSHAYPGKGVYLLKFDNSYSLWRSKTLYYRVYYTR